MSVQSAVVQQSNGPKYPTTCHKPDQIIINRTIIFLRSSTLLHPPTFHMDHRSDQACRDDSPATGHIEIYDTPLNRAMTGMGSETCLSLGQHFEEDESDTEDTEDAFVQFQFTCAARQMVLPNPTTAWPSKGPFGHRLA
ncbi:hypothetical protein EV363DRAFT_1303565 [Boletus edulis]|nr:hypothetical protein EV363DRAFT_1303565 [Boletus edulis]